MILKKIFKYYMRKKMVRKSEQKLTRQKRANKIKVFPWLRKTKQAKQIIYKLTYNEHEITNEHDILNTCTIHLFY